MLKTAPAPIRTTFWKYTLLYFAIVAFGLIWGILVRDKDLLLLTAAIAALGAWRTNHLYQIIRHGKFRALEGFVVSDVKCSLRSGHCVTIQMEDGSQIKEFVAGIRLLTASQMYRMYLYSSVQQDVVSALPEALRPLQTLLGYELIDSFGGNHPSICSAE